MKKLALFLALLATPAAAQNVQQSGTTTAGHLPVWISQGVIGDAGGANAGAITGLGVTASGPGICQNSGLITGPYQRLCLTTFLGNNAQITVDAINGAPALSFEFRINGITIPLPPAPNNNTGTFLRGDNVYAVVPGSGGANVNSPTSGITSGDFVVYDGTSGTLIKDSGVSSATLGGFLTFKSFAVAHTVTTAECGNVQTYSGAFYGITLNAPSSYPTGCQITLNNSSTTRGKAVLVSGYAEAVRLWPGTTVTYYNTGSAWLQNPAVLSFDAGSVTFFWAVAGNDDPAVADCLDAASPCATAQEIVDMVGAFGSGGTTGVTIQFNCDSIYTQGTFIARQGTKLINFIGNGSNPTACTINPPNGVTAFDVQDGAQVTITGFQIGYPSGSGSAINARQLVIVDINDVIFTNNLGGTHIAASDLASVNVLNPTLTGAASVFILAASKAAVQLNGTVSVPVSATFSFFLDASDAEIIGTTLTYSVASIAGQSYTCALNAVISLPTAYPGAFTPGSPATGCQASPP